MKKLRYTPLLISLLLFPVIFLSGSCRREGGRYGEETTDITLHIGMKGEDLSVSTKAGSDPNVLEFEGIRTLRVIIVSPEDDAGGRRILYNEKHPVEQAAPPVLSASLTLADVPIGPADIYVIANEESIIGGEGYTDAILQGEQYKDDNKLLVLDEGWHFFPRRYADIEENGLPMSGRLEDIVIAPGMSFGPIDLIRAVVKIYLTVENATGTGMTLKWVRFGNFISDRVFMFRESGVSLDIPGDTQYKELQYGGEGEESMNVSLEPNARTDWAPVYILPNFAYPSDNVPNPYTLSLGTDLKDYLGSVLDDNINSMVRNTQVNILARITSSASISIDYHFVEWTKEEIDVPSFN